MGRLLAGVALVCALSSASCSFLGGDPGPTAPPGGVLMRFDGGTVAAEVAADGESQQVGLMNRKRLRADAGMLFLFPGPSEGGFWMKNTLIPLSIAFLRWEESSFEVLVVLDMTPCRADPCRVYRPGTSYDAALEVNRGWFKRHGVSPGDDAEAEGALPVPSRT